MKKIVYYNIPAHGHVNPTLEIVRQLTINGHEVVYYCGEEFREKIESAGAIFKPYNIFDFSSAAKPDIVNLILLLTLFSKDFLPDLLDFVSKYKPDIIMFDAQCLWGSFVAEISRTKSISTHTTFVFSKEVVNKSVLALVKIFVLFQKFLGIVKAKSRLSYISEKYKIKKRALDTVISSIGDDNIVFTLTSLQPSADKLNSNFHFIGPLISDRKEVDISNISKNSRPLIYISMGTVLGDSFSFYSKMIEAFRNEDMDVIIAASALKRINDFKNIPANISILKFAPQLKILKQADLFITHAGMNSAHEALKFGVPMILIPWQQEQKMVATRLVNRNCGIMLNRKSITPRTIRKHVHKVISDEIIRENCSSMKNEISKIDGVGKAMEVILSN